MRLFKFLSVAFLIVTEFIAVIFIAIFASRLSVFAFISLNILTLICAVKTLTDRSVAAFKEMWLLIFLIFREAGGLLFVFFYEARILKRISKTFQIAQEITSVKVPRSEISSETLPPLLKYIENSTSAQIYPETPTVYFPLGEDFFAELIKKIASAKRFIYLEFFIISEGALWEKVLELICEKSRSGVEIRIIVDPVGSCLTLPKNLFKTLSRHSISYRVFNPLKPILTLKTGNRDHRKIVVIDGAFAFTGGINIGDEYVNLTQKCGHWKDVGVMVSGNTARSMTAEFLAMWDFLSKGSSPSPALEPINASDANLKGLECFFSDQPFDNSFVSRNAILTLINLAKSSVFITTPYLICDDETLIALKIAAARGVKIKIITPQIPDKRTVLAVTRSYYETLLTAGIEIYEYRLGFIHAKTYISDEDTAIVGTPNLDFRSLFMHAECACVFYNCKVIGEIVLDFKKTLLQCEKITPEKYEKTSVFIKLWRRFLRIFAAFM